MLAERTGEQLDLGGNNQAIWLEWPLHDLQLKCLSQQLFIVLIEEFKYRSFARRKVVLIVYHENGKIQWPKKDQLAQAVAVWFRDLDESNLTWLLPAELDIQVREDCLISVDDLADVCLSEVEKDILVRNINSRLRHVLLLSRGPLELRHIWALLRIALHDLIAIVNRFLAFLFNHTQRACTVVESGSSVFQLRINHSPLFSDGQEFLIEVVKEARWPLTMELRLASLKGGCLYLDVPILELDRPLQPVFFLVCYHIQSKIKKNSQL